MSASPLKRRAFVERDFATRLSDDSRILFISGIVDELSICDFRRALRSALDAGAGTLTVDLSDVDFLPSIALGVLAGAHKAHEDFVILAREGCIAARVLRLAGLPYVAG